MKKIRRISNPNVLTDVAPVEIAGGVERATTSKRVYSHAVYALVTEGYWFERHGGAHWGLLSENGRLDLAMKSAEDFRRRGFGTVAIVEIEEVAS